MKRILWVLLLALTLCGCTGKSQQEATAPAVAGESYMDPTEPAGIYVPGSDLEIQTGGTVRYFLPQSDCYGIRMMGNDVLILSGRENTTLTRYAGNQLFAVAGTQLPCHIMPEDTAFQISTNGITYYDPDSREVVFLDNDLKEVKRLGMSSDMVGKPVLSANRMLVYYCTADAVRMYDTSTGLDKLLKTISYPQQSAEALLLNDTVLRCSLVDERGETCSIFISVQDGQMVSLVQSDVEASTNKDVFYASRPEGIQKLLVYGRAGEDPRMLTPQDPFADSWYLEENDALLTATVGEEKTVLDYYDLSTGLRTASVELPQGIEPCGAEYRSETGEVLVYAINHAEKSPVILAWEQGADPVTDDKVYASPRYTAEAPDAAGLEECTRYAQSLGQTYGLEILIWEDAVAKQPKDYTLEMEYQTAVVRSQLETLERVLAQFPEGFFEKQQRKVSICIVRTIQGNGTSGSLEAAQGVQFWENNTPYVVLAAGESLETTFYHEFFHVMDGKILSDTRIYYHWDDMNPKEFRYFGDYTSYLDADMSQYLQEEDRAFIDDYSMCYPKEDRARIMEYACQPGNEDYFQSEIMQNKLRTLCEGIRKTFGLEETQDALLWEQYLKEPLNTK